jgi:hypothetical protein
MSSKSGDFAEQRQKLIPFGLVAAHFLNLLLFSFCEYQLELFDTVFTFFTLNFLPPLSYIQDKQFYL